MTLTSVYFCTNFMYFYNDEVCAMFRDEEKYAHSLIIGCKKNYFFPCTLINVHIPLVQYSNMKNVNTVVRVTISLLSLLISQACDL